MKTTKLKTTDYQLPAHWVFPLIYDDYSDIDDEEEVKIRKFLADTPGYPVCPDDFQPEFSTRNDAGTLAGDCITITFVEH